jgi:hypothetical protein
MQGENVGIFPGRGAMRAERVDQADVNTIIFILRKAGE